MNHLRMVGCRSRAFRELRRAVAGLTVTMLAAGCVHPQTMRPRAAQPMAGAQVSKEDLRNALDQYDEFFEATIKQAAGQIEERRPDPGTKRAALMWRARMVRANDTSRADADPVKAFVQCWTLAVRMTEYLKTGEGRGLFGDCQSIAISAAQSIEDEIERIGASFLSSDKVASARDEVHAFAAAHPMRGVFGEAIAHAPIAKEGAPSPLTSILSMPLAPFRAMEGIDQGAAAIRTFTQVADRFTDIVEELPESARWELQLLLLDLDQSGIVLSFLASFAEFSCSASRLATTAEKLPEELRAQASKLVADIDARQAGIQATLDRAEKTAATVERALQRVDVVAASIDRTGQSVAEAGRAWEGTARQIEQTIQDIRHDRSPGDTAEGTAGTTSASPPPPLPIPAPAPTTAPASDRPFEILEYRDTANALTTTAQELRALATEVRATIESQKLTEHIRDVDGRVLGVVDHTLMHAQSATDHVAWRAVQLAFLIFLLAVAYRFVAGRIAARTR